MAVVGGSNLESFFESFQSDRKRKTIFSSCFRVAKMDGYDPGVLLRLRRLPVYAKTILNGLN
jgi:hypothetical protein